MPKNYLAQFLASGEFSDLTLSCQGETFAVHKVVVCSQSPVIAAALRGGFKEARSNILNIDSFDVGTAKRMLKFMYEGEYDIDPAEESASEDCTGNPVEPLILHVRVNAIADYYDISELSEVANTKINDLLGTAWSTNGFLNAMKEASSSGDKALHRLLASTAAEHIEELVDVEGFAKLESINDFSLQLLQSCVNKLKMIKPLEDALSQLRMELASETSRRRVDAIRADNIIESINKCLQILSERESCRNLTCMADFNCYIEATGTSYVLRCAKCRCRHTS